jgi:Tfp pilus assembly PilM family ATPase
MTKMSKKTNQVTAAWGLELGGSEVRLARVSQAAGGYRVDAYLTVPLADRWDREPALGECLSRLGAPELDGELAMCVGDSFALTRMLELPAVREQLAAMAQRQMEAMLPSPDRFLMGWAHRAHPLRKGQELVTLCAVRRDAFARLSQAASRLGALPAGVLPSAMALAGGAARTGGEPGLAALLDVGASCTTLSWTLDGAPLATAVIDEGSDRWTRLLAEELKIDLRKAESLKVAVLSAPEASPPPDGVLPGQWAEARRVVSQAATDWAQQIGEVDYALRPCLSEGEERPARCSLYGQGACSPLLAGLVGKALRVAASPAQAPAKLAQSEGVSYPAAATAIGAALCLLEPRPGVCMLSGGGAADLRPRNGSTPRRKWAIAAAWVLGAVLALYGLDVYEAHRARQVVDRVHAALGNEQDMPQQAAVVRYLSQAGAPPLAVLSEVSLQAPPQAVLTSWRYNRSGEMALSGSVSGEQDVYEFMRKLSQSSQFREVTLLSAKSEGGKCQFELALKLSAGLRAAASQPASAASSGPVAASGAASRPADGPPARGPEGLSAPPGAGPMSAPPEEVAPPPGAGPQPPGGPGPTGGGPPVAAPIRDGAGVSGGGEAPVLQVGGSTSAPAEFIGGAP